MIWVIYFFQPLYCYQNYMKNHHYSRAHQFFIQLVVSQHFMNLKVHYYIHRSSPPLPILSQTNLGHTTPSYLYKIFHNFILSHCGVPCGLYPSSVPTSNLCAVHFSLVRATCPIHLILHDLIVLIILSKECKSCSTSVCTFVHLVLSIYFP
jgi:hypothetical protein